MKDLLHINNIINKGRTIIATFHYFLKLPFGFMNVLTRVYVRFIVRPRVKLQLSHSHLYIFVKLHTNISLFEIVECMFGVSVLY